VRANLEQIAAITHTAPARLIVGGGMSRNALLVRLTADTCGIPVHRACEPDSTGLGCAMLVATGAGAYRDLGAAVAAMGRHEEVAPDPVRRADSDAGFAKWRDLYDSLETLTV